MEAIQPSPRGNTKQQSRERAARGIRELQRDVAVDVSGCRYPIVQETFARTLRWPHRRPSQRVKVAAIWSDVVLDSAKAQSAYSAGIIHNHFPGLWELTNKASLVRTLSKVEREWGDAWVPIIPPTFTTYEDFVAAGGKDSSSFYLCKPAGGCMGRGISILDALSVTSSCFSRSRTVDPTRASKGSALHRAHGDLSGKYVVKETVVVQQYIDRPLLVDGRKCDLRVYVLVTSVFPLEIYLYRRGMVRCCTVPFSPPNETNSAEHRMHLANYAVNKGEALIEALKLPLEAFSDAAYALAVRSGSSVNEAMEKVDNMWLEVKRMIVITVAAGMKSVAKHSPYAPRSNTQKRLNFEILGFDVMVDEDLKPWLVEVNHSPSWHTDSDFDLQLKRRILRDTLRIVFESTKQQASADDSEMDEEELEEGNLYERIYPHPGSGVSSPYVEKVVAKCADDATEHRAMRAC